MGLLAADFQNLLIASLSEADPTATEQLQANVPLYWALYARQGHMPELRYWYVRREAIKLLMGCLNQQIDYTRRRQNSARTALESATQDSSMSAVSQEDSTSVANRSASSQYDAETNSTGSGSSASSRSSSQSALSTSVYADIGVGSSTQNRRVHQDAYNSELNHIQRTDFAEYDLFHERGRDSGDATTRHLSVYQTYGYNYSLGVITNDPGPPLPHYGATTQTKMNTDSKTQIHDHIYSGFGSVGSLADPYRHRYTDITVIQAPRRTSDVEMYDRPVADAGSTTPSSASTFTANVDASETANASSSMTASSTSSAQSDMSGAGSGTSESAGSSSSEMTATATRTGSGSGVANRSNQATSQMDSLMERLHQRFLHLQDLWQNANEMIQWLESQRLALPAYVIRQITIQYPEGVSANLAQIANQFLVKQPGVF